MNYGMGSRVQGIFACLRLLLGCRKRNPFHILLTGSTNVSSGGRERVFLLALIAVHKLIGLFCLHEAVTKGL